MKYNYKSKEQNDGEIKLAEAPITLKKKQKNKDMSISVSFDYINIGVYLIVPILIGLLIGYYSDQYFRTRPLLTIVFLIAGALGSFFNLWKILKQEEDVKH